jgi:hypothetical protein
LAGISSLVTSLSRALTRGWWLPRAAPVVVAALLALTACEGGAVLNDRLAASVQRVPASDASSPVTPPTAADPAPAARYSPAMAYDAKDHVVVMFGGATWNSGCECNDFMDDTWAWNGTAWKQLHPADSPPARAYAQMAYDRADGEIVLLGGQGLSGDLTDTWTWNGTNWTQQSPSYSPPQTIEEGMAYFPGMKAVLLYSGDNTASGNGLYAWNGSDWSQITVPGIPPRNSFQAQMAMDPNGSAMNLLIYNPDYPVVTNLQDWTFNGTSWKELTVTTPPTRASANMVGDKASDDLVMFGGIDHNDTWVSTGGNWTQLHPAHSPPDLTSDGPYPGMAYDASTGQVVLFGGMTNSGVTVNTTWTWNGTDWTKRD